MEKITKAIEKFLTNDYVSGSGWGSCSCSCSDSVSVSGSDSDSVSGSGWGSGSGSGWAWGSGSGYGLGLKSFNGQKVYYIDFVPTVIERVKGNLAKGYIVNSDLTTEKCYIAKCNNLFAHGGTLKEANEALQAKILDNMDIDDKIDMFLKNFEVDKKYPAKVFYEWHHTLTGSCEMGRKAFAKNHDIDLGKDSFTVSEFIELTKNDYGGEIIRQLAEAVAERRINAYKG